MRQVLAHPRFRPSPATAQMQVSKRFLALLDQQLAQFTDRPDLRALVVYAALPGDNGRPTLVAIGHWPTGLALSGDDPLEADATPEPDTRRWLALRDGPVLLGALRVDAEQLPWPPALEARLEATARCLTQALRLDLDQQQLGRELARREDQLRLLVHQLRNPLAALRTFGQLLLRRLETENSNRSLVEGLLAEERQLNRYVDALSQLGQTEAIPTLSQGGQPLLLPPVLRGPGDQPLHDLLEPLLQRAAATASLQGRPWHPPTLMPQWRGDSDAVAEILANLLENAFRYSPAGAPLGLHCQPQGNGGWNLTVWDGGQAIAPHEHAAIFEPGVRGEASQDLPGTGLGLALARELAEGIGGTLTLVQPPSRLAPDLPEQGNAFQLSVPPEPTGP